MYENSNKKNLESPFYTIYEIKKETHYIKYQKNLM